MNATALPVTVRSIPTLEERVRLTQRPRTRPRMIQHWRDLLFLHTAIDPEALLPHIPKGLELDLFEHPDGTKSAFLGVIAFRITGVRPSLLPPLPWLSNFAETNVRTYVHRKGREPGVFFISLDVQKAAVCPLARAWYKVPYVPAMASVSSEGKSISYRTARKDCSSAYSVFDVLPGDELPLNAPASIGFFLTERYRMYTELDGKLYSARVWHPPYPLKTVALNLTETGLLRPYGIRRPVWDHAVYSTGVRSEIFELESL